MVFPRVLFWALFFFHYICFLKVKSLRDTTYHISYMQMIQRYLPVKNNSSSVPSLLDCLHNIKCWMDINYLQLNKDKTE